MPSSILPFVVALVLVLCSEGYTIIGTVILKADFRSKMRKAYMAACVSLTVWSLSYGVMTLSHNLGAERILWGIGFIGCSMFFPTWLHFLTLLSGVKFCGSKWRILANYLICAAIAVCCILNVDKVVFVETMFGVEFIYEGLIFKVATIFYSVMVLCFVILMYIWYKGAKYKRQRKQSGVFLLGSVLIAGPAAFLELYDPAFFHHTAFPIATPLILLVSLIFFYTMRANDGLDITVENAANIIFKTVGTPVLLLDSHDTVVIANKAAKKLFRYEIEGLSLSSLIRVNGKSPGIDFFACDRDKTVVDVLATDGARICQFRLSVSRDRYGDVKNKVAAISDITDIQNALIRARDASSAKGDFLSTMSHEIRTPLNAIIGMTKLGLLRQDDPQQVKYSLEHVDSAAEHLHTLINNILDISKIEADKVELHEEGFDLEKLLADVADVVNVNAAKKNIDFLVNLAPDIPCRVVGDRLRLSQILTNLLSNSIKFTDTCCRNHRAFLPYRSFHQRINN